MIGERLKTLRKEKGLSQKELAEGIGTSQGYVCALEQDQKVPGGEILVSLKSFLGVDLNWLLTGEEKTPQQGTAVMVTDEDPEVAELLEGARRVLKSGNPIAFDALERNIRYFDQAVASEKRLNSMEAKLEHLNSVEAKLEELMKLLAGKELKKAGNE